MISNTELENVINLITTSDGTVEDLFLQFSKTFTQDQFKICSVLINLMNSNVLSQVHRILAEYIISESFKSESAKINPFSLNLLEIFDKTDCAFERKFIYNVFCKGNKDYGTFEIKNIQNEIEMTDSFATPEDYAAFKKHIHENSPHIPGLKGSELKCVIPDFGLVDSNKYSAPAQTIPVDKIDQSEVNLTGFQPDFIRPVPTPLEISDNEINWLNPGIVPDFIWDFNMCRDNDYVSETKSLFQKAIKQPLQPEEQKKINEALDKDPKLIFKCDVTPQKLPQLIEQNAAVASTVIKKLLPSTLISSYLEKLIEMELSLPLLETVNKVITTSELPKEFLTLFITNCISHCEQNTKDKMIQGRRVRLVCVFVKSLIKNKVINPREMYIELQAFCIEFNQVQEANQLFKMLKQLEPNKDEK